MAATEKDEAHRWRLRSMKRSKGLYWLLETGRNETRQSLSLGYVTEFQAQTALRNLQREEEFTAGTPLQGRLLKKHEKEPDEVVAMLVGDRPIDVGEEPVDHGAMTAKEYFDKVYWRVRSNPKSDIGVAEATAAAEAGYFENVRAGRGILQGEIGETRMRDLNDQHWVRWEAAQTQLSGRAKVLRRNAYAAMLSYARKQGHITFKPEFFRIKGATKTTRPKQDPLSLAELLALMDAATRPERGGHAERVPDQTRRTMWAVGAGLGLRPGELVRVSWEDVNWEERTVLVRGTKTEESWDRIPMTPIAHRELRLLHVEVGQPKDGPCFLSRGKPFGQFKKALDVDRKAAGINRPVTPYLLRHSFATIAWSLGIEMDVARRILRHTDESMLRDVYCRPRPADLVARVAAFDVPTKAAG